MSNDKWEELRRLNNQQKKSSMRDLYEEELRNELVQRPNVNDLPNATTTHERHVYTKDRLETLDRQYAIEKVKVRLAEANGISSERVNFNVKSAAEIAAKNLPRHLLRSSEDITDVDVNQNVAQPTVNINNSMSHGQLCVYGRTTLPYTNIFEDISEDEIENDSNQNLTKQSINLDDNVANNLNAQNVAASNETLPSVLANNQITNVFGNISDDDDVDEVYIDVENDTNQNITNSATVANASSNFNIKSTPQVQLSAVSKAILPYVTRRNALSQQSYNIRSASVQMDGVGMPHVSQSNDLLPTGEDISNAAERNQMLAQKSIGHGSRCLNKIFISQGRAVVNASSNINIKSMPPQVQLRAIENVSQRNTEQMDAIGKATRVESNVVNQKLALQSINFGHSSNYCNRNTISHAPAVGHTSQVQLRAIENATLSHFSNSQRNEKSVEQMIDRALSYFNTNSRFNGPAVGNTPVADHTFGQIDSSSQFMTFEELAPGIAAADPRVRGQLFTGRVKSYQGKTQRGTFNTSSNTWRLNDCTSDAAATAAPHVHCDSGLSNMNCLMEELDQLQQGGNIRNNQQQPMNTPPLIAVFNISTPRYNPYDVRRNNNARSQRKQQRKQRSLNMKRKLDMEIDNYMANAPPKVLKTRPM